MAFVDYYEVLGISRNSSGDMIKAAYRTMCKKYHPDTYTGNRAVAEGKIRQINEAYAVLRSPLEKSRYDAQYDARRAPRRPAQTRTAGSRPAAAVQRPPAYAAKRSTPQKKRGLLHYLRGLHPAAIFGLSFLCALVAAAVILGFVMVAYVTFTLMG